MFDVWHEIVKSELQILLTVFQSFISYLKLRHPKDFQNLNDQFLLTEIYLT